MFVEPLVECPECRRPKLVKLISGGAAIIIKGTENPCRGTRGGTQKKLPPKRLDRLGEGKNKGKLPPWRDGPIDKNILKNPKKYILEGEVD